MTLPTLFAADVALNVDPRAVESGLLWIVLLPMLGALLNGLFGWRFSKGTSALIACASVFGAFCLSVLCFLCVFPDAPGDQKTVLFQNVMTWFAAPSATGTPGLNGIHIDLAFAVDRFSSILLLVITGIGFLIHLYSISYMSEERSVNFARYFAYLNLFVGMMLTLVLGANLVVLFVGWEGVGLASYLLIGFWWDDDQKAYAGRKAFVANRIGDFGFLLGIFTLLATLGTVDLYAAPTRNSQGFTTEIAEPLRAAIENPRGLRTSRPELQREGEHATITQTTLVPAGPFARFPFSMVLTLAALLLFLGACGKSAQIPLYVWLPDAMAGPTPVSALIHAATMVTAGVYMTCRLNYLVGATPDAMMVIAFIGAATALFAAIIGTQQDDIKKVLAYSTVSQLGFMVLGVGVGAFWAASLHLLTHAFFKACLFLGAGSVMHAMANETNIWKMGGLRKDIPYTAYTFLIATIAITGVIPLSGFFSKDAILDAAVHSHWPHAEWVAWALYLMGTTAALGTAFYMFRAYLLTFEGERRALKDHHAHEAPLMYWPLVVLAALSIIGAAWGLPFFGEHHNETLWANYLRPIFEPGEKAIAAWRGAEAAEGAPWLWWGIALVVGWAGFGIAYAMYGRGVPATDLSAERPVASPLIRVIRNKFYVDELYDAVFIRPTKWLAYNLWKIVDQLLIDTVLVRGWGFLASGVASLLRGFQNGSVQRYAAVMAISLAVILFSSPARGILARLFPSWFGH